MGGGEECLDLKASLLDSSFSSSSSTTESKNETLLRIPAFRNANQSVVGNVWSALAHIITVVIGSGVLSLAWSMSRLGWIAAPLTILCFASVTGISASLLCNCYKSPDPDIGPKINSSYLDAVHVILGKRNGSICGVLAIIDFIKAGIVLTITAAISIRAILCSNCYHNQGHEATCDYKTSTSMLLFGLIQILVSQIPKFQNTAWLSVVATIMSFTYSFIGSGLGLAKIIGANSPTSNKIVNFFLASLLNGRLTEDEKVSRRKMTLFKRGIAETGEVKGSIGGVPTPSAAGKAWSAAEALGNIAFSFAFPLCFLEIQDTLRSPPSENATMKKASISAICITTIFYLCCGGFGYAAFGDSTPGNLLTGFGFYEPYWLIDFANACIVLHLVGAYQVLTQPLFAIVEGRLGRYFSESGIACGDYCIRLIPPMPPLQLNVLRICFRSTYVVCITTFAMIFPYFNQVVAVSGAITFWPLVVYFPVEMYIMQKNIQSGTPRAVILRSYSTISFVVILFSFIGSVKTLISARFS